MATRPEQGASGRFVVDRAFGEPLREPNFFNGRLLSAEDLRAQQEAAREAVRRLGLAAGPGVVTGLGVEARGADRIAVEAGLALNGAGDSLRVRSRVDLRLRPTVSETARAAAGFQRCARGEASTREGLAEGLYLLTIAPEWQLGADEVPRVGLETLGSRVEGCGRRWREEGVVFELLPLPATAPDPTADEERFLNLLEYWAYGWPVAQPLTALADHAEGIATVPGLEGRHVPLALVQWDGGALGAVLVWAARRPLRPPLPAAGWSAFVGARHAGLGIARFLGFEHALDRVPASDRSAYRVRAAARFLPPAGLVPLLRVTSPAQGQTIASLTPQPVFGIETFFAGLPVNFRGLASPEEARLAIDRSLRAEPLDVDAGEPIDCYVVPPVPLPDASGAGAVLWQQARKHGKQSAAGLDADLAAVWTLVVEALDARSGAGAPAQDAPAAATVTGTAAAGTAAATAAGPALGSLLGGLHSLAGSPKEAILGGVSFGGRSFTGAGPLAAFAGLAAGSAAAAPEPAAFIDVLWALYVRRPRDLFGRFVEAAQEVGGEKTASEPEPRADGGTSKEEEAGGLAKALGDAFESMKVETGGTHGGAAGPAVHVTLGGLLG